MSSEPFMVLAKEVENYYLCQLFIFEEICFSLEEKWNYIERLAES